MRGVSHHRDAELAQFDAAGRDAAYCLGGSTLWKVAQRTVKAAKNLR